MKSFDLSQRRTILTQFRHSGVCLDDAVVLNVLYLLQELQATMSFAIVDPLVLYNVRKQEHLCKHVKETLHSYPGSDIVLMPITLQKHWSLLVFIPSLNGYMHFDSIRGYHRRYVNLLLLLLDETHRYTELQCHSGEYGQQLGDWECGFFTLMNAFLFIHAKKEVITNEDTLRLYLARHTPQVCEKNVRRFARKIYDIVLLETGAP